MRLYLRRHTWWLDVWIRGERVRVSLDTSDRAEAERRAEAMARASGSLLELVAAFDDFMAPRRTPKAHASSMGRLRKAIGLLPVHWPGEVRRQHIDDLLAGLAAEGRAPKTLNHFRAELRQFFAWLRRRGDVTRNPAEDVAAYRVPAPRIRFLNDSEIDRLREALVGDLLEPIALTLLYAGLRRSEAVWLDWPDVDLERGVLSVRAKGKAWQPKTGRNRVVPISSKLAAALEAVERRALWVFSSPKGHRWDPDNLTSRWRRFTVASALPDWTLLDLRHTFATHLIRKPEVSFAKLAALMGNSPEICRRHYAHVATEDMHEDVEF